MLEPWSDWDSCLIFAQVLASVSQSQNSESEADLQLQKAEFAKATAKVKKEVMQWNSYQEKKDEFQRTGVTIQAEIADKEKDRQRKAVENCQDELYPIREVLELPHGMTFAEASLQKFKDEHRIPDDSMYRVFWMNPTVLGYDAVRGCEIAVASVATAVAEDPHKSIIIVAAPTCGGRGNELRRAIIIHKLPCFTFFLVDFMHLRSTQSPVFSKPQRRSKHFSMYQSIDSLSESVFWHLIKIPFLHNLSGLASTSSSWQSQICPTKKGNFSATLHRAVCGKGRCCQ